jgi:HlyD family secretion protein
MDIPRQHVARNRALRWGAACLIAVVGIAAASIGLGRLKPAAPDVDRAAVWIDVVKRGEMVREVRGLGTLVPEQTVYIPAPSDGRVERVVVLPGVAVNEDTVLVELRSPELEQEELEAKLSLQNTEADVANFRAQLQAQKLGNRASTASMEAQYKMAKAKNDHDSLLHANGLMLDLEYRQSTTQMEDLAVRLAIEKEKEVALSQSLDAQLDSRLVALRQQRNRLEILTGKLAGLKVRAGVRGVLQQLLVESGKRVGLGASLAVVVQPERLKAELKVAETQAKDVQLGQKVAVDTRNGVIQAVVARIDPSVRDGSVVVDARLTGALPAGARPDLSVDGTIEIERLENIVYVGRPTSAAADSSIGIFVVDGAGGGATRRRVKLGRSSVNTVEVIEGLRPGEEVILSDMSQYENSDRVRLR